FNGNNQSNFNPNWDLPYSLLWSYCGNNYGIWKCPADSSTVNNATGTYPRVRSVSMNAWLASTDVGGVSKGFLVYKKMSDLIMPGPSMTWAFIDEREDSINDGEMIVSMNGYPNN